MNTTDRRERRPYTDFLIRLPMGGTLQLGWNNIFLTLINIGLTIVIWRKVSSAPSNSVVPSDRVPN